MKEMKGDMTQLKEQTEEVELTQHRDTVVVEAAEQRNLVVQVVVVVVDKAVLDHQIQSQDQQFIMVVVAAEVLTQEHQVELAEMAVVELDQMVVVNQEQQILAEAEEDLNEYLPQGQEELVAKELLF